MLRIVWDSVNGHCLTMSSPSESSSNGFVQQMSLQEEKEEEEEEEPKGSHGLEVLVT